MLTQQYSGVRPSAMPNGPQAGHITRSGSVLGKPVSSQGLITANAACFHNMYKTRQNTVDKYEADELFGRELGPNYSYLSFLERDLAITPRVHIEENGHERTFEGKPVVFPSMNGLKKPRVENLTNAKLTRYYRIVGVAATARRFGPDTNFKGGVSLYIAGSFSIYNRSNVEFQFGDLVRAVLPHVDRVSRDNEQKLLPHNANHPEGRLEPILAKFEPTDAYYLQAEPLTQSFAKENVVMRDISRLIDPDVFSHQDDDVTIAQALRIMALWGAYVGITTWGDTYGDRIEAPNTDSMAAFKSNYNLWQNAEIIKPNIISKSKVTIEANGTAKVTAPDAVQDADKNKRYLTRLFVAAKLGLFRDDQSGSGLRPNQNLMEAIVARTMRSFIMDPAINDSARISKTFGSGLLAKTSHTGQSGLNTIYNTTGLVGQLEYIQSLAGASLSMSTFRSLEMLYDSVIGRCIKHSLPGSELDIVVA